MKETKRGNISYETREGFPVELAASYTTYKGIGTNQKKTEMAMLKIVEKPGCAYVGLTRNREPKDIYIPPEEFPSALDLRLQRLSPLTTDAENLERHARIKSAQPG